MTFPRPVMPRMANMFMAVIDNLQILNIQPRFQFFLDKLCDRSSFSGHECALSVNILECGSFLQLNNAMPKIFLKPNSAEFADSQTKTEHQRCNMPGCDAHAEHKAPKDRGLNEYYWFCLQHVQEYNKAWNFFEGMSAHEVEEHTINSLYGDRPTWRYDVEGAAEDILKRKAWQSYHFTEDNPKNEQNSYNPSVNRNTPEMEALAIMGLDLPVTLEDIKTRYKLLAKKHHPDLNKGCAKSEDLLKSINMAYTILKLAYEQFEELPER